ncbi:MAG: hypothetical protein LBV33_05885 [Lachnospiraceae bacterium]|jgi:hypothetical protein|nr:hypothetical protein [Lachnospiraceae bacterium]
MDKSERSTKRPTSKRALFIILPVALLVFYALSYFYMPFAYKILIPSDVVTQGVVFIRAEANGEAINGSITFTGGDTDDVSGDLSYMRAMYYDNFDGTDKVRSLEIRDQSDEVLMSIPRSELVPAVALTVDVSTGEITHGISYLNYITGCVPSNGPGWLTAVYAFAAIVCIIVMIPASFIAMLTSPFRTKPVWMKRSFSGSYVHFAFCLLVSVAAIMLLIVDPEKLIRIVNDTGATNSTEIIMYQYGLYLYFAGTLLYPFAHRAYNASAIRESRRLAAVQDFARANTFKYTETTWSDGSVTSTYGTQVVGRNIGILLVWFIKLLLAPYFTYHAMIKNYLFNYGARDAGYELTEEEMAMLLEAERTAAEANENRSIPTAESPVTTQTPAKAVSSISGEIGLSLIKTSYAPGEAIQVFTSGISAIMRTAAAFVAIYETGAAHKAYKQYKYPRAGNSTLTFTAPRTPGNYEMRLYARDGVYTDETFVTKVSFKVIK